jgi:hypothetical protein
MFVDKVWLDIFFSAARKTKKNGRKKVKVKVILKRRGN